MVNFARDYCDGFEDRIYRTKAQQAERRAARASSLRLRNEFLDLARQWSGLVAYLERLSGMPAITHSQARP
jgi:hypothetical protein